jgi:hypothetical protein
MYDWLLNHQVLNVNGTIMVNHTMRYEKKRVAAEPLRGGIHGFGYNFLDHYPGIPYRFGYYLAWNIVIRTLPDHKRGRQVRLLNMSKAQITTFCEQQGGIGVAPNVHPTWKSWKRLRGGLVEVALGFIYRAAGSTSNLELTVQDELSFPQGQSNHIYDCSPLNQPLVI